jgi:RNA polymerase subunit RPABC4/transcription elongation factor Spt4
MSRLLALSIIAGVAGAILAERKGRNWLVWAVLSALFPLSVLLLIMLPPVVSRGLTKRCPHCEGIIRHRAAVCSHCGKEMPIEMVQCGNCGKFVPEGDYCPECSRSLR